MTITKDRIKEIEACSSELIHKAFCQEDVIPPVNLDKIIKACDLALQVGPFTDKSILGAYDKAKKVIYIDEAATLYQKTFTIAHEIGHSILHTEKPIDIFYRKDEKNIATEDKLQEQEANYFATSLLMPNEWLELIWRTEQSIEILATRFAVSPVAAHWRLVNAGLISE